MSKCACCREEFNKLLNYKGYKVCSTCYIGYVNKVKVCGNNAKYETKIDELKQQLAEKDKLLKCYQEEEKLIADILGDKDLTIIGSRVHLENLIVELKNKIKDRDIVIEEKDKEIEKLKTKQKPIVMHSKEDYFKRCNFLEEENIKLQFAQTQLAIQELEKVKDTLKHFCNIHSDEYYGVKAEVKGIELDVCESIDYQIRELKGNNDEPRQSN